MALNSTWRAHDNLLGLVIHPGGAEPVFAGQDARFIFRLENPDRSPRFGIALQWRDQPPQYADVPARVRRPLLWPFPPAGAAGRGRAASGC
ncbi:MAG: hypothetical protein U1F59_09435 [Candidatus Competibacteraceae bacterium]